MLSETLHVGDTPSDAPFDARPPRGFAAHTDAVDASFDDVMDAARALFHAQTPILPTAVPPEPRASGRVMIRTKTDLFSEMFEPRVDDPKLQRRAEMRASYRADLQQAAQPHGRPESGSSVFPADAAAASARSAEGRPINGTYLTGNTTSWRQADVAATETAGRHDHSVRLFSNQRTGAYVRAGTTHEPARAAAPAGLSPRSPSLSPTGASPVSIAGSGEGVRVGAASNMAGRSTGTPAQQIGQLLTAGRGEANASILSAASTAEGGMHRSTGSPGQTKPPTQAAHEPSSRPSDFGARAAESSDMDRPPKGVFRAALDSLVRSIRLGGAARYSSARLQLYPPELGRIDVDVRVAGKAVQIRIRAQTTSARRMILERAAEVTSAMERQGILVERFDVFADAPGDAPDSSAVAEQGRLASQRENRWPLPQRASQRAGAVADARDDESERGVVASSGSPRRRRLDISV